MEVARQIIADVLADAHAPAVLWSAGADSTLLLHLVREQASEAVAIWFNTTGRITPPQPALSWAPADVYLLSDGSHHTLVHEFDYSGAPLPVLTDLAPGDACVLTAFPHRTPHIYPPFDVLFAGWKDSDQHWIADGNQLPKDGTVLGQSKLIAPLRHMTDAAVRAAIVEMRIPYTPPPDELPVCSACMTADSATVWCSEQQRYIPRVAWDAPAGIAAFRTRFNLEDHTNGQRL